MQQKYRNMVSERSFSPANERQCHYCAIIEARLQRPLFRARENRQSTSLNIFKKINTRILLGVSDSGAGRTDMNAHTL